MEDEITSSPLMVGMNVIRPCWGAVFQGPGGPVSFSCQNSKSQRAWRNAFAVCQKIAATPADGFLGYIWPVRSTGIQVPARSEVVVWGQARTGPGGKDYFAMVEGHQEPSTVSVAKTLVVVNNGRVPVRIRNLNPFSVSLGRYQKLGRLFHVEEADVLGARSVSLTPEADGTVDVGLIEACVHTVEGETSDLFDLDNLIDRPDLTEAEQDEAKELLRKWEKVFAIHEEDFGRTGTVKHNIPTGDANPIRERFRPLPPMMYKEVRALLSDMLEKGVLLYMQCFHISCEKQCKSLSFSDLKRS